MRRILSVADYIFKQSFRNRMLNVLVVFAILTIGFSVVISSLAQETEIKMVQDFGLFSISIFAFFTLLLSITIQMFEETELKTISMVIVKPINRHEYLIGKYLGICATIFMNVFFMLAALMLVVKAAGGEAWDPRLILSVFYSFLGTAMLSSIALLLSVVATNVPTCIIFLLLFYVLGHLTIHLKNIAAMSESPFFKAVADVIYYSVPNFEAFNLKDKIYSYEGFFSPEYLGLSLLYTVTYSAFILITASYVFSKKEFY